MLIVAFLSDRDVGVEVSWNNQRKTGALFARIEADGTRTLEIRMPPAPQDVVSGVEVKVSRARPRGP